MGVGNLGAAVRVVCLHEQRRRQQRAWKYAMNMHSTTDELLFELEIEDDWPPVAVECLPCVRVKGGYRVEASPVFVKNLSVGDVISVSRDERGNVSSWAHVRKSGRTTIWLAGLIAHGDDDIADVLPELHARDCNTVEFEQIGRYSIDVPAERSIHEVGACLSKLDQSRVAIAYPSFRHEE
jgi:hypothetical protein